MAKWHRFNGSFKWIKFRPDQLDTKFDDDGVWTCDFYPDDPEQFRSSGVQLEPKDSPDGVFFRLRRKKLLVYRDKETKEKKEIEFAPPAIRIKTADGLVPFSGHDIGNGSRGTAVISVFVTKKGYGHRWEGVDITDLVEITSDGSGEVTKTPNLEASVDLDDDIPF